MVVLFRLISASVVAITPVVDVLFLLLVAIAAVVTVVFAVVL